MARRPSSAAAHWAQRAAEEEQEEEKKKKQSASASAHAFTQRGGDAAGATSTFSSSARGAASRDARALANWLDLGGSGGASGGHVASRVAVMCLVHALAKAELPVGWTLRYRSGGRRPPPSAAGRTDRFERYHSAEQYRASKTLADEALELARDAYRAHAVGGVEELLRVGLAAVSGGDPDLRKETYRRGSSVHRKKIRAWQLLCAATPALVPLCDPSPSAAAAETGRVTRFLAGSLALSRITSSPPTSS